MEENEMCLLCILFLSLEPILCEHHEVGSGLM